MISVRYCTAGVWHVVRFVSLGSALLFMQACERAIPRHVSAVALAVRGVS